MLLEWHHLPQMTQAAFYLWGLPEVDLLASFHTTQCQHYYTLETPLPLEALRLNAFNHPWMFQVSYVFPPATSVSLVLSKFLAESVKGQLRLLILVAPCWIEAPWLPTILNMLVDIPWQCPIIKDLVMDVSVGHVLKCLSYLHLTHWLFRDMCCADGFSSSVSQEVVKATQVSTSKVYQQCWKKWAGWCAQEGVPNNAISAPKIANFLVHLFRAGMAWHTIGIYHFAISAILEPDHLHKASNHPVISKSIHHLYLQYPPSYKHFDPWDVKHLVSLLQSWAPASSHCF